MKDTPTTQGLPMSNLSPELIEKLKDLRNPYTKCVEYLNPNSQKCMDKPCFGRAIEYTYIFTDSVLLANLSANGYKMRWVTRTSVLCDAHRPPILYMEV